jgi:ribosome-associated toxin RatA of RatAB toxin-antitoxin module
MIAQDLRVASLRRRTWHVLVAQLRQNVVMPRFARSLAIVPFVIAVCAASIAGTGAAAADITASSEWRRAGIRDGVALQYRNEAGGVRVVRAVTELLFPAERIAALVCDFSQYPQLLPDVREARVVANHGAGRYEIYMRYAPRFIVVAARDVVVRVERFELGAEHGCRWQDVSGSVTSPRGTVRMRQLRGHWTMKPVAEDRAHVTYEVAADPAGRIPRWLVRRGALDALPDVIARVQRVLASSP